MDFEITAKRLKEKVKHTIKEHFEDKKVDLWVKFNIEANGVLSGSAISSIFHDEKPKDYDIYFRSEKVVADLKLNFLNDPGAKEQVVDWKEYADNADIPLIDGKCLTERAATLKNDIQFILMGTLDQCRPTFDFIHCMPYYDFEQDKLYISERQLQSIADKMLVLNPLREKPASSERIIKFQYRGWKLDIRKSVIPKADLTKVANLV